MRLAIAIVLGAFAVGAAGSISAAPLAPSPSAEHATNIIQVAGWCGPGWHPNRWGGCSPNRYGYYRPYRYGYYYRPYRYYGYYRPYGYRRPYY
jgi:hypothetical protein